MEDRLKSWFQPCPEAGERLGGLDGLRGLTMLMVILCHLNLLGIGWIGLSSFFVLSGFLITRILLKDWQSADSFGFYLRRFYARRFLRIFPIYYLYLFALLVATFLVPQLAHVREQIPYALAYVYNLYGAIEFPQHTRMLVHLWSLSVEEQFYLIWPLAVALLPVARLRNLALGLIAAGPFLRAAVVQWWPLPGLLDLKAPSTLSVYALTTTYLDAFAFGALINFVDYKPKAWHIWLLVGVALAAGGLVNGFGAVPTDPQHRTLVLGWPLYMSYGHQYVWGYTLVNLFWFQIICAMVHDRGAIKRFFSMRILDFLGKRSYSTYILHYPLLALLSPILQKFMGALGPHLGSAVFLVPFLPLAIGCAALSYRYIETPALNLKQRFALTADRGRAPAPAPADALPATQTLGH